MKKIIYKMSVVAMLSGLVLGGNLSVFAEEYDMGTVYPTYDTGTVYPTYDTGAVSPTFNTGTVYPPYSTGGAFSPYDTGTVYPPYNTGTTGSVYDTGTVYPSYNTGSVSPAYDTGTVYPIYNTGTSQTYDTGTVYPNYNTGSAYPVYDTGSSYPVYDTGSAYPVYDTGSVYGSTYGSSGYVGSGYVGASGYYPSTTWGASATYINGGGSVTTPVTQTYTCPNGTTVYNLSQCPTVVTQTYTCPNGSIVSNLSQCPTVLPTYTCPNGQRVNYSYQCSTTTTVCSDGLAPVNGSCNRTTVINTNTNTVCSDGLAPVNGSCVRTNTINTVVNTICSDGSYPVNGSCVRSTIIPTNVITYQTCWDGSVLPNTSVCPSQYKVCANGNSVYYYQTCYAGSTYTPYVAPPVIRFNNVVTSVATQVTTTSGRCNGIGLIAQGAQSTGWFEYGETGNLGRQTAQAAIGSSETAPFSNVLANLKPHTTYYCRAVMQNQYGTVKGEIVAFTTKSKSVAYVAPVSKTVTKTVTKTVKKNEVICSDGTTVSAGTQTSATLLNQGQKLIALQVEKTSGTLSPDSKVAYTLSYKNLSDSRLTGVLVKVTIPQEISVDATTAGNYDQATHMLTLNQDSMDPFSEGMISWTGHVAHDATIGKSIVATAYSVYTVPGTQAQDEVTAYVVGSILPNTATSNVDTGTKHVIGAGSVNFLPNTLVEWLALIAILFIVFILGRSIYASYQEDKHQNAH
jgi:hypothetical protein